MIKIEIPTLTDSVFIENVEYLLTPKTKVIELVEERKKIKEERDLFLIEREEVKKERAIIKSTIIKFLLLLGIMDEKTQKIKEGFSILSLANKLPKIISMFNDKNSEGAKMIDDLKPLLNKYAND